jgi:hypothetical protein
VKSAGMQRLYSAARQFLAQARSSHPGASREEFSL